MDLRERLNLFQEMVLTCHDLYLSEYDRELSLIRSNCPDETLVRNLFLLGDVKKTLADYAALHTKPLILTNLFHIMWAAIPEKEGNEIRHYHILGPFFISDRASQELEEGLKNLSLSFDMRVAVQKFLRSLPVISINRAFEYTIMLYYCITGERIGVSDLHYRESDLPKNELPAHGQTGVHGTYEMEQEMVRMVREGDLNIQSHLSRLAVSGNMGVLATGDGSRQLKNAVLVCIVLFSRAAIEGGLSPETAMALTDHYFQSVEASRSMGELTEIAKTMQNDFVQRVHRIRTSTLSKPVIDCCDYIKLHLEDNVTLRELAARFRYSETYLSRKFHQETGLSFKEYLRKQRLSSAKSLLREPGLTIQEISDRLRFCSPSYFSEQFKAEYGLSPTQFRNG